MASPLSWKIVTCGWNNVVFDVNLNAKYVWWLSRCQNGKPIGDSKIAAYKNWREQVVLVLDEWVYNGWTAIPPNVFVDYLIEFHSHELPDELLALLQRIIWPDGT